MIPAHRTTYQPLPQQTPSAVPLEAVSITYTVTLTGAAQLVGIVPQTGRPPVQFPARALAWGAGSASGWGTYGKQPIGVSFLHQLFPPNILK